MFDDHILAGPLCPSNSKCRFYQRWFGELTAPMKEKRGCFVSTRPESDVFASVS